MKTMGFIIIDRNKAVYFDSFRIEYIPQEVLNKIKHKSMATYSGYKKMILLCVDLLYRFHKIYDCRKKFTRSYQCVFS